MHDPRYDPTYGVFYISDPTPGRHTIGSHIQYELLRLWSRVSWAPEIPRAYVKEDQFRPTPENALKLAACGMVKMVFDSGGFCTIGLQAGVDRIGLFEYMNAAAGWDKTPDEYMEIGRRIQTLRQAFNLRQGIEPTAVTVNAVAFGQPPLQSGPLKGKAYDLHAMRKSYWEAMHWDPETGHPLEELVGILE